MPLRRDKLLNFVLYQLTWFACVLLVGAARPGWAAIVTFAAVGTHIGFAERSVAEGRLVALAGAVGLVVDSVNVSSGFYAFPFSATDRFCPPWIVAMWMLFAITLRSCMRWITSTPGLAAAVGFVGGPLSFLVGERFGAVRFADPRPVGLLVLGLAWAVSLPLLARFATRKGDDRELVYGPLRAP